MVVFLQAGPMAMDSLGWGINKIQCQSSKKFNWRWILVPFILPALSLVELPIRWWFVSKSLCTLSDTTAITAWDITSKAAAPSHSKFAAKSKSRRHAAAMLTHWSWALREQFWDVDLAEVVSWVATCAAITFCQQSPCHQQFRVEWLTSSPTHNWTFQFSWMSRERFTFVVQLVHCLDTATTSRIFSPWKSVQWFYAHAWYARRQKCKATKRGSMTLPAVIFKCGLQMNQKPIHFWLGYHSSSVAILDQNDRQQDEGGINAGGWKEEEGDPSKLLTEDSLCVWQVHTWERAWCGASDPFGIASTRWWIWWWNRTSQSLRQHTCPIHHQRQSVWLPGALFSH